MYGSHYHTYSDWWLSYKDGMKQVVADKNPYY